MSEAQMQSGDSDEQDDETSNVQATLRASVDRFESMIERCALDGDTEHSNLYVNVLDDHVQVLQATPGEVVISYGSFGSNYFDDLSLKSEIDEVEVSDGQGNQMEYEHGCEAILDVDRTLEYLDYASSDGTVVLSFSGDEDRRLSTKLKAEGALEAWVNLPGSQTILDDVPHWLPTRFNEEDVFSSVSGDPAPTRVKTTVGDVQTIIDVVQADQQVDYFPIVVEDGDFKIDVGESHSTGVRGRLGNAIEGSKDVENYYFGGFEEIFNALTGSVELQPVPDNGPLAVVQRGGDGDTIRHINGPANV